MWVFPPTISYFQLIEFVLFTNIRQVFYFRWKLGFPAYHDISITTQLLWILKLLTGKLIYHFLCTPLLDLEMLIQNSPVNQVRKFSVPLKIQLSIKKFFNKFLLCYMMRQFIWFLKNFSFSIWNNIVFNNLI